MSEEFRGGPVRIVLVLLVVVLIGVGIVLSALILKKEEPIHIEKISREEPKVFWSLSPEERVRNVHIPKPFLYSGQVWEKVRRSLV